MSSVTDRTGEQVASYDACLVEIREADEGVRANTQRLSELRRAYALDNGERDRLNT